MFESHQVGVALVPFDPYGSVHLLHRIKDDLWALPGGRLDQGEEPAIGLSREVKEEFGLALDPLTLTPLSFSHGYHAAGGPPFIMLYFGIVLSPDQCAAITNAEPHKHSAIRSFYCHPNFGWSSNDVPKYWGTDLQATIMAYKQLFRENA